MTHSEDDIMALVFGGATVEKTTTISSSHDIDSTHIERTITVTKSFTHDADGDHVTVEVHREVGAEDHGAEFYKHGSATFQAHVETDANGERHLELDGIDLHRDIELPNGHEIGVEVHLREAPAAELGDRSPSRLSTATDATSILAETYHVHHDEQELSLHLDDEHHDRDHIPFRTAQQDALVAQFKELHAPPLPTSAPPSEHVSRRGTYIEETSILDDPIEIDREHELERIRIEAERVAELKRTLSKASEHEHHHHHHRAVEDYSSDEEGSVVPLSATHYEFDDRASIARTESFISQQSKRDSIDVYHEHEHHAHPVAEKIAEFEVAEYVERKLSAEHHNMNSEPAIGHGASVTSLNVITPVTSPITESVFMSPVSPVPAEGHEYDSQHSSLNPRFSGPHIRDSIKAVEVLEHELEHHHHHHHHHEHVARHDSITSAGAVVRALEEMDNALQHHSSASIRNDSSSVPPSPAPSRDEGAYSLNGSVRHKHHLYERLDSYSRASTPSGPPPPVPLWDLIKEEEIAREENVRDAPAPLHRAAPLSHLEEISSKNSVTTGSVHHHEEAVEAVALAHHIHHHHDSASLQGSVRSVGSRYGSKHSLAQSNGIGEGAAPAAVVVGAGVAPARKYTADSNHSSCKSRGTSITLVEDGARSRGSTLTEANVNGVHVHEHHHHPVVEAVAAHLIHEHIERRVEEEIAKEIIHHHLEHQSTIEYEHQKPVSALLSKFGGGERKVYTKEEAAILRREREAEEAVRAAAEHAAREAERRIAEEAAALAAATRAAEEARLAVIRAAEEEAARHAAQVAAAAAIHHHEQQQAAAHHGHSRTASVVSHRSAASYHVPPTPDDVAPIASRRDSYAASVRTTRSVMGHRAAASRDPFATLTRPPPQHYVMAGYTRNPMTSPSLVKKSPLHAAVDANKFSSVRVVRNVRGFIKEWGQKDFVPPARSPLSPTLAVWHEEGNASRRSSIISEGGQSLIGRPAHMEAAPRSSVWQTQIGVPPTPTDVEPALTPLTERRREYEQTAAITGLIEEKHHHGLPPMVNLLA